MNSVNTTLVEISNLDYPGLFQGADAASASAQKVYFLLQRIYLGSLVAGAVISAFTSFLSGILLPSIYTAIAVLLALGILIMWITRARQDDRAWFDCRAVAESTKTATWRFMMGAPPFQNSDSLDKHFVSELQEIRCARSDCQKYLAANTATSAPAITTTMRQVKDLPFDEKKKLYLQQRLLDQKAWYSNKAQLNAANSKKWFFVAVSLQALAVTLAIIQAVVGGLGFNIVSILTTCIAVVTAWTQMKRHDELTKTYSLAAQEFGELEALADSLTEKDFPQFVEQVEEAISREHTMWCARRDVLLPHPR